MLSVIAELYVKGVTLKSMALSNQTEVGRYYR